MSVREILFEFFNSHGVSTNSEIEELIREISQFRPRVPRLPWDQFWMLHAHLAATRSTCDRGPDLLLDPGRHGVGAVIVRENRLISGGYNGSPPGEPHCSEVSCPRCDWTPKVPGAWGVSTSYYSEDGLDRKRCPSCGAELVGGHLIVDSHCQRTLHAEENALLQCAMDRVSPCGASLYTTAGPCYDCAKRILRVGIKRVFYAENYESRHGLSGEALKLLQRNGVEVCWLDVREALR